MPGAIPDLPQSHSIRNDSQEAHSISGAGQSYILHQDEIISKCAQKISDPSKLEVTIMLAGKKEAVPSEDALLQEAVDSNFDDDDFEDFAALAHLRKSGVAETEAYEQEVEDNLELKQANAQRGQEKIAEKQSQQAVEQANAQRGQEKIAEKQSHQAVEQANVERGQEKIAEVQLHQTGKQQNSAKAQDAAQKAGQKDAAAVYETAEAAAHGRMADYLINKLVVEKGAFLIDADDEPDLRVCSHEKFLQKHSKIAFKDHSARLNVIPKHLEKEYLANQDKYNPEGYGYRIMTEEEEEELRQDIKEINDHIQIAMGLKKEEKNKPEEIQAKQAKQKPSTQSQSPTESRGFQRIIATKKGINQEALEQQEQLMKDFLIGLKRIREKRLERQKQEKADIKERIKKEDLKQDLLKADILKYDSLSVKVVSRISIKSGLMEVVNDLYRYHHPYSEFRP